MIAADTSSLSAFFKGEKGADVDRLAIALGAADLCLPPVVLTELLSDPRAAQAMAGALSALPLLPF